MKYTAIQGLVEELKERDKTIKQLVPRTGKFEGLELGFHALREQTQSFLPPSPKN